MIRTIFIIFNLILICTSCIENKKYLFDELIPNQSNIHFSNRINENDTLNILKYEYIFNGAGVGLGDFNNDGLTDIYFTGNQVSNKLYLNKGNLKFDDVTNIASVQGNEKWCSGVSLVDINNDNLLDIYISATTYKQADKRANLLYINKGIDKNGVPHFIDLAHEYGIADTTYSTNAVFFDYDNDEDLDLYVLVDKVESQPNNYRSKKSNFTSESIHRLYKNEWSAVLNHPVFTDISKQAGIIEKGFGLGVNICDINLDGWKDIYVTNDFLTNDFFFINNQNGTFTNKASSYFKHTSQSAMGNDVNDINNDGLADIIAVDMMPRDNQRKKMMVGPNNYNTYQNNEKFGFQFQYPRNTLQLNRGSKNKEIVFSEIGLLAGMAETDWSWCPMVVDFDNDGFRDIIITNGFPKDVTDRDFMAYQSFASTLASNADLLKEIPSVKIKNFAFKNNGNLTFANVTDQWGILKPSFSNGAAYADLDNDGDLDYVVNNINDSASVFKNNLIEQKSGNSNFLRIKLNGGIKNNMGLGAFIEIAYNGKKQVYENNIYRGYLSTVENIAHFGIGNEKIVEEIKITWQTGKVQLLKNIKANQVLTINYDENDENSILHKLGSIQPFFTEVDSSQINFFHHEQDVIDFNVQKLLPHKLSQYGPALSVGDVNNDGFDDVFVGGPSGISGSFLIQNPDGKFSNHNLFQNKNKDKVGEDMGSLLFDADSDNDLDLYIVGGGGEQKETHDRFYKNNNKIFIYDSLAILFSNENGSCIKGGDIDKDGDIDLFIGGRVKPGFYPMPVSSRILRNDSKKGSIKFTDITISFAPQLINAGLICDALWTDFDNDGWLDLALVGEWMPIIFFKNEKTFLKKINSSLDKSIGWWNSIAGADFDNDGDIDYVAGNFGTNSLFRASNNYPFTIYGKDFDKNGSYDAIPFVFYNDDHGKKFEFPFFGRDDMVKQMVSFRKKFTNYKSFANATVKEIFQNDDLKNALMLKANYLQSAYIENKGKGIFKISPLPIEAQFAPLFGLSTGDFNDDGNEDIIINGNDFGVEVGQGRLDALNGLMMLGNGKGNFLPQSIQESGILIPGDGKALVSLTNAKGKEILIASQNKGKLKCFEKAKIISTVKLRNNDFHAQIFYKNGKRRKEEFYYGNSFLSQSSRELNYDKNIISSIEIVDYRGVKRKIF